MSENCLQRELRRMRDEDHHWLAPTVRRMTTDERRAILRLCARALTVSTTARPEPEHADD